MRIILLVFLYHSIYCYTNHDKINILDLHNSSQFAFSDHTIAMLSSDQVVIQSLDSLLMAKIGAQFDTQLLNATGIDQYKLTTLVWNKTTIHVLKVHLNYTLDYELMIPCYAIEKAGFMSANTIYTKYDDRILIMNLGHNESILQMSYKLNKTNLLWSSDKNNQLYVWNVSEDNIKSGSVTKYQNNSIDQIIMLTNTTNKRPQLIQDTQGRISYTYSKQNNTDTYLADCLNYYCVSIIINNTIKVNKQLNGLDYPMYSFQLKLPSMAQDTKFSGMKILFNYDTSLMIAFINEHTICYQYIRLFDKMNNIFCMHVIDELRIQAVEFEADHHKILVFLASPTIKYVDEFDQCLLFNYRNKTCNMVCTQLPCLDNCHQMSSSGCKPRTNKIRAIMMGQFLILILGFMAVNLIYNLLKQINFSSVCKVIALLFKFVLCDLPRSIIQAIRYLGMRVNNHFIRWRNQAKHLPLQNQPCPICLDGLNNPVFFPCLRHMACNLCMKEYQEQFTVEQLRCPFRD